MKTAGEQFGLDELPYGFIKQEPKAKGKVDMVRNVIKDQGKIDSAQVRSLTGYENPASIIKALRTRGDKIVTIKRRGEPTVWALK